MYAKMYRNEPMTFWNKVLWTDESKFNLFGSDGKVMVWRTPREELDPKCTVPTVKHGGGNVKVWGCFSTAGVGRLVFIEGNMTGQMYADILEGNLFQSVKQLKLGKHWIMQQDNDPKHRSRLVTNWLDKKKIKRLFWPPFSPDLNPIEHIWDEMERRMKTQHPKNVKELKQALLHVWNNIEKDVLKKLVDSVPNRLREVLKMRGYPTRY